MPTKICAATLTAFLLSATSTLASPLCIKSHQSFALNADTITLQMKMQPGGDCIQGLRRSYMQIYAVKVIEPPKRGTLTIVGSGYRYLADPTAEAGQDSFTLVVEGKNRKDPGSSTVTVIVNAPDVPAIDPTEPVALSGPRLLSASTLPLFL
jgi:hypothetical protein